MSLPEEDIALEVSVEEVAPAEELDELELDDELLDEDEVALLLDPQAVRLRVAAARPAIRVVVRVIFTLSFLQEISDAEISGWTRLGPSAERADMPDVRVRGWTVGGAEMNRT